LITLLGPGGSKSARGGVDNHTKRCDLSVCAQGNFLPVHRSNPKIRFPRRPTARPDRFVSTLAVSGVERERREVSRRPRWQHK
jgi:hypothetical protein